MAEKVSTEWWVYKGELFDLTNFVDRHPGGRRAIMLGKNYDCTALVESYHLNAPSSSIFEKYKISDENEIRKIKESELYKENLGSAPQFSFDDSDFYSSVKTKVLQYFKEKNVNHKASKLGLLAGFFNIFMLFVLCWYTYVEGVLFAAMLHGIARGMIIVCTTHAASHFSFSTSSRLNDFTHAVCMVFAGTTPKQWSTKHSLAHHVSTNINPEDEDTMWPIKLVLRGHKRFWFHKYQHLYMWIFYPFTVIFWTLSSAIKIVLSYFGGGLYEGVHEVVFHKKRERIETAAVILLTLAHRFVIPLILLPFWRAMAVMALSEGITSLWFVLQFVVNHEIPDCVQFSEEFDKQLERQTEGRHSKKGTEKQEKQEKKQEKPNMDWGEFQVRSSHNYGLGSDLWLHCSGGLNYQIEHHLFPSVHYSWYKDISQIVQETCAQFSLPYPQSSNFFSALAQHYQLLKMRACGSD